MKKRTYDYDWHIYGDVNNLVLTMEVEYEYTPAEKGDSTTPGCDAQADIDGAVCRAIRITRVDEVIPWEDRRLGRDGSDAVLATIVEELFWHHLEDDDCRTALESRCLQDIDDAEEWARSEAWERKFQQMRDRD